MRKLPLPKRRRTPDNIGIKTKLEDIVVRMNNVSEFVKRYRMSTLDVSPSNPKHNENAEKSRSMLYCFLYSMK